MKTRTSIALTAAGFAFAALYVGDLAALFIALFGSALFWQGHSVEVKLNKLLDHYRLYVSGDDLNE